MHMVLWTENKPNEIRDGIVSSFAVVHDSHFKCGACILELCVRRDKY